MAQAQVQADHYINDGTRVIKIIGCEYRLLEPKILDWLSMFGEVVSEITEELFEEKEEKRRV